MRAVIHTNGKMSLSKNSDLSPTTSKILFSGWHKAIDKKIAEQKLKETQNNDKIKTKWAKSSPYTLHRVIYNEDVEKRMNEILETS